LGSTGLRKGAQENTSPDRDSLIAMWIYSLICFFLKWALHFLSLRGDGEDLRHTNVLSQFTTAVNEWFRYRSVILRIGEEESKKQN